MIVDPYDPAFQADPYPTYARLRADAPVLRLTDPDVWMLTRHADVHAALRNPTDFSSACGVAFGRSDSGGGGAGSLIATDAPDHTRLRRILARQFTPRAIAALEADVRTSTATLVAELKELDRFDVVDAVAGPLPTRIIATYLGIDPAGWRDYKRWSDVLNEVSWAREVDAELGAAALGAGTEAVTFFAGELTERRRRPRPDLIGTLAASELTDAEILSFCVLLLLAGNVTTSSVLAHAVLLLLQHPEQRALLDADPSLVPAAVEEVVRFESPIQGFVRTLTRDVALHGTVLPAGDQVMLMYGSASRDDAVFPAATTFDVRRDSGQHVAFGAGPHFCLGAWLARLEVRVAVEALLPLLSTWRLDPDRPVERVPSPAFREIAALPVVGLADGT